MAMQTSSGILMSERNERLERLAAYNALPTVYTQNIPLEPSPNAITTPYPGAMRNPAVSFQCFALRPTWQCLDLVGINPGSAAVVHIKDSFCPIRLSLAGVELSLLPVLDESVREGVVLVPAWVFQVLTFEEGAYADISAMQPPKSSRGTAGHGSDGSVGKWHVHLEGPLTSKFDHCLTAPFFSCSSEILQQTMLRQIRRAGLVIGHTNSGSSSTGKAGGGKVVKPIPKAMPVSSMSENASWGSGGNAEGGGGSTGGSSSTGAGGGGKSKKNSGSAPSNAPAPTTTSIFDQGSQVPSSSNIFESGILEQLKNSDGAAAGLKGAAAAKAAAARVAATIGTSTTAAAASSSTSPEGEGSSLFDTATKAQAAVWSKSSYVNGPSLVAIRMMGQVLVFRVVEAWDAAGKLPEPGTWARPTSISIAQAVDFDRPLPNLQSQGAARAARLLTEAGFSASGSDKAARLFSGLRRKGFLLENIECGAQLPHFLADLRRIALDELGFHAFVHFPLMELAWDLPSGGDPGKTFRRVMAGLISNFLPAQDEAMPPCLVVLWSLEGPVPTGWGEGLEPAVKLLSNLHPSITFVGLTGQREDLPGALRSLFEAPEPKTEFDDSIDRSSRRPSTASRKDEEKPEAPTPILVGCDVPMERLTEGVLHYYADFRLFKQLGSEAPPRVLIHGPPGSGKTHLLTWLVSRLPHTVKVSWLNSGDVWSKYLGDSEAKIRTSFKEATQALKTHTGSILILENIDLLAPQSQAMQGNNEANDGLRDRITATLLTCLDGVDTPMGGSGPGLTVIATSTVAAELLDSRITRPGRMDVWVPTKLLGPQEMLLLLRKLLEAAAAGTLRPSNEPGSIFSSIMNRSKGVWKLPAPTGPHLQTLKHLLTGMTPQGLNRFVLQFERREPTWQEVVTALQNEPGIEARAAAKKALPSTPTTRTGKGSRVTTKAPNPQSGTRQGAKGASAASTSMEVLLAQASQVALPESSEDEAQQLNS